ncbi:hypothetical protein [Azospirillum soli]|uniref:hypothetical protein n=1 Tax=Azospirillum soli TaxID=1304799 RepID=UPI001AE97CB0|nr:hypothetical protein [Azospirillum soli]MBP2311585.1 hypothetical protein [Azospirillum soli]
MRGWMRPLMTSTMASLTMAALMLVAGNAFAQDAEKAPAAKAPPKTMSVSPMAQVPFPEQPFPLRDDGSYKAFLEKIAADVGRRCSKQENYGWEFRKGDQEKMDRIFQSTMASFEQNGWLTGPVKARSIQDPETTAYLADKDKRRLLMVWVPMSDAAMMIMCETEGPATKK